MEELINFLVEIANYLKYGKFVNHNKSFEKELSNATYITDSKASKPRALVSSQLSILIKKGDGTPTFAYFKRKKQDWYNILILNEHKKYYCHLNMAQIPNENMPDKFFLSI